MPESFLPLKAQFLAQCYSHDSNFSLKQSNLQIPTCKISNEPNYLPVAACLICGRVAIGGLALLTELFLEVPTVGAA